MARNIHYRKHDWIDLSKGEPRYGIQAKEVGWDCRWMHCAEGGKPLMFDTAEQRDSKLKELRKKKA